MCAYQGVTNVSFSENVANVLNELSLDINTILMNVKKKYFHKIGDMVIKNIQ